jgi:hypothetical protein
VSFPSSFSFSGSFLLRWSSGGGEGEEDVEGNLIHRGICSFLRPLFPLLLRERERVMASRFDFKRPPPPPPRPSCAQIHAQSVREERIKAREREARYFHGAMRPIQTLPLSLFPFSVAGAHKRAARPARRRRRLTSFSSSSYLSRSSWALPSLWRPPPPQPCLRSAPPPPRRRRRNCRG